MYVRVRESKTQPPLLLLHEGRLFRGVGRIQEFGHGKRELLELYRFRHIRIEARFYALCVYITQDVG